MKNIYIFDVDGTLTPSRKMMVDDFVEFFEKWSRKNIYYLVSGSDIKKMKEQVPQEILDRAEGLFTCGGNDYIVDGEQVYFNEFNPPNDLIKFLEEKVYSSEYPYRAGNHIEDRNSMVNFSIVGRDCDSVTREDFFRYDNKTNERKQIADEINEKWPKLEAVIGGQISIDIAPKGNNKSQILFHIRTEHPSQYYIFIGDRTMEGGNDYPLAKKMNDRNDCSVFQAGEPSDKNGYKETYKILKYKIYEGYPDFSKSPRFGYENKFIMDIHNIDYLKEEMKKDEE